MFCITDFGTNFLKRQRTFLSYSTLLSSSWQYNSTCFALWVRFPDVFSSMAQSSSLLLAQKNSSSWLAFSGASAAYYTIEKVDAATLTWLRCNLSFAQTRLSICYVHIVLHYCSILALRERGGQKRVWFDLHTNVHMCCLQQKIFTYISSKSNSYGAAQKLFDVFGFQLSKLWILCLGGLIFCHSQLLQSLSSFPTF